MFARSAIAVSVLLLLVSIPSAQDVQSGLDKAYREWNAGFSSPNKDVQLKTLRSMLPTKSDLEYLLPKHADKLWPLFEKGFERLEQNVDKIADEVTRFGEIQRVDVNDVRKDELKKNGSYKQLLTVLPIDVAVCTLHVVRVKGSSGSGSFLRVNNRWIWIKDMEALPEFLDKIK